MDKIIISENILLRLIMLQQYESAKSIALIMNNHGKKSSMIDMIANYNEPLEEMEQDVLDNFGKTPEQILKERKGHVKG